MSDAPGATGGWWSEWRRDTGNTAGTGVTNCRRHAKTETPGRRHSHRRLQLAILFLVLIGDTQDLSWPLRGGWAGLSGKSDENLVKPAEGRSPTSRKTRDVRHPLFVG